MTQGDMLSAVKGGGGIRQQKGRLQDMDQGGGGGGKK